MTKWTYLLAELPHVSLLGEAVHLSGNKAYEHRTQKPNSPETDWQRRDLLQVVLERGLEVVGIINWLLREVVDICLNKCEFSLVCHVVVVVAVLLVSVVNGSSRGSRGCTYVYGRLNVQRHVMSLWLRIVTESGYTV